MFGRIRCRRPAVLAVSGASLLAAIAVGGILPAASAARVVKGCTIVAYPTREHHTTCSGHDLSGAGLSYEDLSYANLSGANLSGADVWGADLSNANLQGTVAYSTNFAHARLCNTTLTTGKVTSITCSYPAFNP